MKNKNENQTNPTTFWETGSIEEMHYHIFPDKHKTIKNILVLFTQLSFLDL